MTSVKDAKLKLLKESAGPAGPKVAGAGRKSVEFKPRKSLRRTNSLIAKKSNHFGAGDTGGARLERRNSQKNLSRSMIPESVLAARELHSKMSAGSERSGDGGAATGGGRTRRPSASPSLFTVHLVGADKKSYVYSGARSLLDMLMQICELKKWKLESCEVTKMDGEVISSIDASVTLSSLETREIRFQPTKKKTSSATLSPRSTKPRKKSKSSRDKDKDREKKEKEKQKEKEKDKEEKGADSDTLAGRLRDKDKKKEKKRQSASGGKMKDSSSSGERRARAFSPRIASPRNSMELPAEFVAADSDSSPFSSPTRLSKKEHARTPTGFITPMPALKSGAKGGDEKAIVEEEGEEEVVEVKKKEEAKVEEKKEAQPTLTPEEQKVADRKRRIEEYKARKAKEKAAKEKAEREKSGATAVTSIAEQKRAEREQAERELVQAKAAARKARELAEKAEKEQQKKRKAEAEAKAKKERGHQREASKNAMRKHRVVRQKAWVEKQLTLSEGLKRRTEGYASFVASLPSPSAAEAERQVVDRQEQMDRQLVDEERRRRDDGEMDDEEDYDPLVAAQEGIEANTMKVVNLKMEGLEDEHVFQLLTSLKQNTSVHTLILDGNEMEVNSFMALRALLEQTETLRYLSLNFVILGELGCKAIVPGLISNSSLRFLSVSGNDLFENGMEALAVGLATNTSIETLILSENSISDGGCETLAELMKTNTTLTALDLSNNYINEEGGEFLGLMIAHSVSLQRINLERNSLGDEGLQGLSVGLSKTNSLKFLNLENNIIDIEGVLDFSKEISKNYSLEWVGLKQNIFDTEGEMALLEVLVDQPVGHPLQLEFRKRTKKAPPPLPKSEMDLVISHFGSEKLFYFLQRNLSLQPLVDIHSLLVEVPLTIKDAYTLWDMAFTSSTSPQGDGGAVVDGRYNYCFHPSLKILCEVLAKRVEEEKLLAAADQILPSFRLSLFLSEQLPIVVDLLAIKADTPRLTSLRLQLSQIIRILTTVEDPLVLSTLTTTRALALMADLFFHFKRHSIYQFEFSSMITALVSSATPQAIALLEHLFVTESFLSRLVEESNRGAETPVGLREPHFAHMALIANSLVKASQGVQGVVTQVPEWVTFAASPLLQQHNELFVYPEELQVSKEQQEKKGSSGDTFGVDSTELPPDDDDDGDD
eukprot:TRINITY_DN12285_c0_g1_i1.p1 TRINITY_DN12285_c0_g1~~TRINITY_DN12285_c0_g1_i1.p1  ORF type:complete len:1167 (-),score=367.22 TRINITY_DN12285_c0_g1_i1:162-3662(-)